MTILDAIRDRNLFGRLPGFANLETWRAWLVFLKAVYGLPLEPAELALFRKHTARTGTPPPGGFSEAVCIVGRQAGKSYVAALVAVFEAMLAGTRKGSHGLYSLLIAQDHRAALRVLLSYVKAAVGEVDLLRGSVRTETATTIGLDSGVSIGAYPCRPAAIRGLRSVVTVIDELAFFVSSEGNAVDREMLRAVRPTLATTGGKLLVLSSPYGQEGALWDLYRRHHGENGSPVLVWQASAPSMNPTLPADYLERMAEEDPEAYRSEVLGEFRAGLSTLFDPEALEACVVRGRRELPPAHRVSYKAFTDPSGGKRDAFTLAVGHLADDVAVVDCCAAWKPPFNPSGVVEEACGVLKDYGVRSVVGDRYAGEWPREQFRRHGVEYRLSDLTRSELYLEMLPVVNRGGVELPDLPELLRELRGLERRRGAAGKDRVDHRPGAHDDRANAVAGLVVGELKHRTGSTRCAVGRGQTRCFPEYAPAPSRPTIGQPRPWDRGRVRTFDV